MQKQKLSDDAGSKDDQVDNIAAPTTPEQVAESADSDSARKPTMRVTNLKDLKGDVGTSLDNLPGPQTPRPRTDEDEFPFDRSQ